MVSILLGLTPKHNSNLSIIFNQVSFSFKIETRPFSTINKLVHMLTIPNALTKTSKIAKIIKTSLLKASLRAELS